MQCNAMQTRHLDVVRRYDMTGLFCETTCRGDTITITPHSFELPYKGLPRQVNESGLAAMNDSFKF